MSMTLAEVEVEIAKSPEHGGVEARGSNPFLLDSQLEAAGVPSPRSLYLIEEVSE
jgi:hypothetical protein